MGVNMKKKKDDKFTQGQKAGAAPFEKVNKQIADEAKGISEEVKGIRKEIRNFGKIQNDIIDGCREISDDVKAAKKEITELQKTSKKSLESSSRLADNVSNIKIQCSRCGALMGRYQMVCGFCGTIVDNLSFDNIDFEILEKCKEGVTSLSKIVMNTKPTEKEWVYSELKEKYTRMKKIQEISKAAMFGGEKESVSVFKKINTISTRFIKDYENKKIEIAVVGNVKAGKSSLINALIGIDLASVDATPETSNLIKYRTTTNGNYIKVSFYNKKQWQELWNGAKDQKIFSEEYKKLDAEKIRESFVGKKTIEIKCSEVSELKKELHEWSDSKSSKHFFVSEIEVGYESNVFPHDIFLVDTPGLSDPVKFRSDITRKYIKNSDWILACISGENLSQQQEFNFLCKVSSNKGNDHSKIFVVATKRDTLTEDACKKKADEFLIRLSDLYGSEEMAASRFSFVAAECHLFTKKVLYGQELNDSEKERLSIALIRLGILDYSQVKNKQEDIIKYAGVEGLFKNIEDVVISNKRQLIRDSIISEYDVCMEKINELSNSVINNKMDYLKQIVSAREVDQETIDEIQEANDEIIVMQQKIHELKSIIDKRIKELNG